jgi:hypothetical protein
MRIFPRSMLAFVLCFACFVAIQCGKDNNNNSPTLPTGCQAQGIYAIAVTASDLACFPTNAFTDPSQAVGAPDAGTTGTGKNQFKGFVSLGINGSVTLYMGSCIADGPGADLRVYQTVSKEAVEVQISQSVDGPFVSLGMKDCGDPGSTYSNFCDFDIAGSGVSNPRVVKVFDREVNTFPGVACDNAGSSPGADLDAVEVLHPGS